MSPPVDPEGELELKAVLNDHREDDTRSKNLARTRYERKMQLMNEVSDLYEYNYGQSTIKQGGQKGYSINPGAPVSWNITPMAEATKFVDVFGNPSLADEISGKTQ